MFSVLTEFILPEIPKIQLFSAFLEIIFWICVFWGTSVIYWMNSQLSMILYLSCCFWLWVWEVIFFLKEGRFTHECLNVCLSICRPIRVLLEYVVLEMFSHVEVVWEENSQVSPTTQCVFRQIHMYVTDWGIILQWEFVVKIKTS